MKIEVEVLRQNLMNLEDTKPLELIFNSNLDISAKQVRNMTVKQVDEIAKSARECLLLLDEKQNNPFINVPIISTAEYI